MSAINSELSRCRTRVTDLKALISTAETQLREQEDLLKALGKAGPHEAEVERLKKFLETKRRQLGEEEAKAGKLEKLAQQQAAGEAKK